MNERMKKIKFVVNPISGTQSKELILNLLDEKIDKARYTWEVVYTERAGHAVEIAAKAAEEKADIVVAIGGDGTINEIARSLVHTDTALGIIPCGSGNGLARHLHIPMEPKKALEVLNEGCLDTIDYGKINGTDFFCTCGVGFDAFVSLKFAHAGKRGLLTYLEKTLQESLKYQPETYELETENGVSKYKAFLIACGNASQYGNNAYIVKARMQLMRDFGCYPAANSAFLLNLGLETLAIRMKHYCENAMIVAAHLEASDKVVSVSYPGLKNDKYYELGRKYLPDGCSGVISFTIKGGRSSAVKFMDSLKLASNVVHVADIRTCVLHPASATHRQLTDEQLVAAGIDGGMIRFSCGLENVEDILADIDQALEKLD